MTMVPIVRTYTGEGKDLDPPSYKDVLRQLVKSSIAKDFYQVELEWDQAIDGSITSTAGATPSRALRIAGTSDTFELGVGESIVQAFLKVDTTLTSASGTPGVTIGIPTDSAAGILGSTAIGNALWTAASGVKALLPLYTAASATAPTTAIRNVTINNASSTSAEIVNAGKIRIFANVLKVVV